MGERAIALCPRPDGTYCRYDAQWAGAPAIRDALLRSGWSAIDQLVVSEWRPAGTVALPTVFETLDYLSVQAVYLLDAATIQVVIPIWFGVPHLGGPRAPSWVGAVVRPDTAGDLSGLLGRTTWLKDLLGRALDDDALTVSAAIKLLWHSLYSTDHHVPATVTAYLQEVTREDRRG